MAVVDRLARLEEIKLESGSHQNFEKGVCAMELVSYLADEPFSDHPKCVSPVVGQFLRSWDDALDDEGRQKLKPYLARAISTSSDGRDEERAWLLTDWLVRVCAPAWLEPAGVKDSPAALRGLPPLKRGRAGRHAPPTNGKARERRAAAGGGGRDGARDAARAAPGDAARAAARDAAGDAARDAARDAAGAAARGAAGDAARDAARAALEPTKVELQASALELLDKLVKPEIAA